MSRAIEDKQFHKALNVFLYSYFIQNYNWFHNVLSICYIFSYLPPFLLLSSQQVEIRWIGKFEYFIFESLRQKEGKEKKILLKG